LRVSRARYDEEHTHQRRVVDHLHHLINLRLPNALLISTGAVEA
jgi:hypothetical protein